MINVCAHFLEEMFLVKSKTSLGFVYWRHSPVWGKETFAVHKSFPAVKSSLLRNSIKHSPSLTRVEWVDKKNLLNFMFLSSPFKVEMKNCFRRPFSLLIFNNNETPMHKCDIHKSQKKAIYFVGSGVGRRKHLRTVSKTEALLFIEMEESSRGGGWCFWCASNVWWSKTKFIEVSIGLGAYANDEMFCFELFSVEMPRKVCFVNLESFYILWKLQKSWKLSNLTSHLFKPHILPFLQLHLANILLMPPWWRRVKN